MNQKGQAPITIILGVLIAVMIAGGAYYFGKSSAPKFSPTPIVSQTPTPSPTTSRIPLLPEKVAENFYNNYLNCIENHFQNPNGKSPTENCSFRSANLSASLVQKLENAKGMDPILCAQSTPGNNIIVDKSIIQNNQASVTVHTFYENSGDVPINLELTRGTEGYWQITNIICRF